jgi:hypothetical protein
MRYAFRDWRVIARYRGVPAVCNRRELRRTLLLQMTPAELAEYHWKHGLLLAVILLIAATAWFLVPPPALWWFFFFLLLLYRLRYWRIDPITSAMQEYNHDWEAAVREQCSTVRQQRIDSGFGE